MFHEDMDEDDSNVLSTDVSPGTEDNTTTATTDNIVGTRVNTTSEMVRQLQTKAKYQQATDFVKKRKLIMGSHHGILTSLSQY